MLVLLRLLAGVVGEVLVGGQEGLDGEGSSHRGDVAHTAPTYLVQSNLTILNFTIIKSIHTLDLEIPYSTTRNQNT